MILGVHHAAVSVADTDRSLAFYRDLLGFEMLFDAGRPEDTPVANKILRVDGTSCRSVMLRTGNVCPMIGSE